MPGPFVGLPLAALTRHLLSPVNQAQDTSTCQRLCLSRKKIRLIWRHLAEFVKFNRAHANTGKQLLLTNKSPCRVTYGHLRDPTCNKILWNQQTSLRRHCRVAQLKQGGAIHSPNNPYRLIDQLSTFINIHQHSSTVIVWVCLSAER